MDLNIGKKLDGRYEITELIGIGGMADVYKAVDVMENRVVAVKILKTEFSENEEFLRRFRNESKAIAVLSHPNIVKIYDVGFSDEIQFIVMEYIDGITLKEFIEQQGALRWKDALHFITQILRALQHAHDRGIVHRDIKPQNIMLFPDGTIKVMDFGIARFSRVDGKTLSDKTIGSVHYISPEQARGDFTDERSDIYSVGAMLYEMLTGRKMFDGENPVSIALMHMQDEPTYPRTYVPSIPEALEEIVMHAVEKEPAKRYQSAAEMIRDIDTFKMDQNVVFGYIAKEDDDDDGETTKYFSPVVSNVAKDDYIDDDDYDAEEAEEEERRSYVFPILCAVAVAVVLIACIIIAVVINGFDKNKDDSNTLEMPNLVNTLYSQAQEDYDGKLVFNVTEEYNSVYGEGIIFEQSVTEGKTVKIGATINVTVSKGMRMLTVPDSLVGFEYTDSIENTLKQMGFEVKTVTDWIEDYEAGYIYKVDPGSGSQAPAGSTITVYISNGPLSNSSEMPLLLGLTKEQAIVELQNARFTNFTFQDVDVEDSVGKVVSQSFDQGTLVPRNEPIVIGISTGIAAQGTVNLTVPIPKDVLGSFIFNIYNDTGAKIGSQSLENAGMFAGSHVTVAVNGAGTQTIMIEVLNTKTNARIKYATYTVDFTAKVATPVSTDAEAFLSVADTTTTTTTTTTNTTTTTTTTTTSQTETPTMPPSEPSDPTDPPDNPDNPDEPTPPEDNPDQPQQPEGNEQTP